MYCKECGYTLPEQSRYCPQCGTVAVPISGKGSLKKEEPRTTPLQNTDQVSHSLELPEEKGRFDRTAPPAVSPLTIFFAIIGLVLILILLNPWHAGQEKPADFQGTRGASPTVLVPGAQGR